MPIKKKPVVAPRKRIRLTSKGKRPMVGLDDNSSSHTALEPQTNVPPSPKPATPPTNHMMTTPKINNCILEIVCRSISSLDKDC